MRDYSKVSPRFWNGKTGKALKDGGTNAVVVAMYLMTCPHSNMIGLFYVSKSYIAVDTGLSLEEAEQGLRWACEVGFCEYDECTEIVWVRQMATYQIASNLDEKDNRCKCVQKEYDALPENPFLSGFYAKYVSAFHMARQRGSPAEIARNQQTPSKPLLSQEQEQEQKQNTKEPKVPVTDEPITDGPPPCPYEAIRTAWNTRVVSLPEIKSPKEWSATRKRDMLARWRERWAFGKYESSEKGLEYWKAFFDVVESSDFLSGRGARPWGRCSFDWVMKAGNFAKIIEGNYANSPTAANDVRWS